MDNIQLPKRFVKLLSEFRDVFTAPTFNYFQVIIAGILLAPPKKAITKAVRLAHLEERFSNVHRAVSQYRWDPWQLGLTLLGVILRTLRLGGPLTFALDSSVVPKYGRKIFGCGFHFNHAHKHNMARYIWGHDWVIMGVVCYVSLFRKWLCLPFLAKLMVPETSLQKGEQHTSRVEIAGEMVRRVKAFVKQSFILVTDGAFAKRHLITTCIGQDVILIGRLQKNAVLYGPPPSRRKRRPGRPRKYGKRLPSLASFARSRRGFHSYHLVLYGKERSLQVKRVTGLWKPAGQAIQVLIVYYEKARRPAYFFCTDLSLSVEDILRRVAARWSLETLLRDAKEQLGLEDWQCRVQLAVSRSVPLTCVAATLLVLWSYQEASQEQPELWDPLPWYNKKSTPSMQDMLHQLRCRSTTTTIFGILDTDRTNVEKSIAIRRILRVAA